MPCCVSQLIGLHHAALSHVRVRACAGPGPPFVEPEDPASASVVDAMPLERFAFFPPWLLTTHGQGEHNRGRSGWWADHLVGAPISTMLHLHAGLMNTDHNKLLYTILEMPLGWDYDLAEAAEKRPPYISTRAHGHVPPLVALAPGVVHSAMGEAEFVKLLQVRVEFRFPVSLLVLGSTEAIQV